MKKIILLLVLFFAASTAYSACWGEKHVLGTGGSTTLCVEEENFKRQKEKDAFDSRREAYENKRAEANKPKQENIGQQAGNDGNIFNIGTSGSGSGSESASGSSSGKLVSKHNISLEWHAYKFPKMMQLDRQMPDQFYMPRSFRYEWYLNRSFGFGALYESYRLASTKEFDPITSNQDIRETVEITNADGTTGTATREVNKDIPYLFPGAINNVKYENLWYFVTFNSALGVNSDWHAVVRFGSALISNVTIEYNDLDMTEDENEYAVQPEDRDVSSSMPMFFDFAIEWWADDIKVAGFVRFVEAENETSSYLDMVPMGGTTVGMSATFGIPMFGHLGR